MSTMGQRAWFIYLNWQQRELASSQGKSPVEWEASSKISSHQPGERVLRQRQSEPRQLSRRWLPNARGVRQLERHLMRCLPRRLAANRPSSWKKTRITLKPAKSGRRLWTPSEPRLQRQIGCTGRRQQKKRQSLITILAGA